MSIFSKIKHGFHSAWNGIKKAGIFIKNKISHAAHSVYNHIIKPVKHTAHSIVKTASHDVHSIVKTLHHDIVRAARGVKNYALQTQKNVLTSFDKTISTAGSAVRNVSSDVSGIADDFSNMLPYAIGAAFVGLIAYNQLK